MEITQGGRKFNTGIVVDHVQEVLDIAGEDIEEAPQFGASINTDFILGMGKIGDSVKILLDIDEVLSSDDLAGFAGVKNESKKTTVSNKSDKANVKNESEKD